MAQTQGRTGKAGNITIGGVVVPITKWSAKTNVEFADATDSGNYNPGDGNLYKSQLSGDTQIEASIEGNWDAATTSANITSKIKAASSGPYALVLKIDGSTTYCSGNFDLTDVDVQLQVPGASMVTFTATAKSNGTYSLN